MINRKKVNAATYKARYSHALVSYSYSALPSSAVRRYIHRKNPNANTSNIESIDNYVSTMSTNPIFLSSHEENVALSVAIGFNPGGDITFKLPYKNYATLSLDGFGFQGILQHRLTNSYSVGQSLDLVYHRYQYYGVSFVEEDRAFAMKPDKMIGTNELGIRSVTLFHGRNKTQAFLYMTIVAGYNITLRTKLISLGVSLGVF